LFLLRRRKAKTMPRWIQRSGILPIRIPDVISTGQEPATLVGGFGILKNCVFVCVEGPYLSKMIDE
jgi:hypothetical protein